MRVKYVKVCTYKAVNFWYLIVISWYPIDRGTLSRFSGSTYLCTVGAVYLVRT